MARATTSLPTPLSPRIRTVVLVTATFETRSRIGCILPLPHSPRSASLMSVGSPCCGVMTKCSLTTCSGLHSMCHVFTLSIFQ